MSWDRAALVDPDFILSRPSLRILVTQKGIADIATLAADLGAIGLKAKYCAMASKTRVRYVCSQR
jgi:hypothetical protein